MMMTMLTLYIVSFMRKYLKVDDKHWRPRMKILQNLDFMIKKMTIIVNMGMSMMMMINYHGHNDHEDF